jgi:hypothetical protein
MSTPTNRPRPSTARKWLRRFALVPLMLAMAAGATVAASGMAHALAGRNHNETVLTRS